MSRFECRVPSYVEPGPARAGMLKVVLVLVLGLTSARPARGEAGQPVVELRIASRVAEATATTLRAAVASQLAGLATLAVDGARGTAPELGVIYVEANAQEIVVRIVDFEGRPLASTRRVPGPLAEASASEIASIAHAFVVAAVAARERNDVDARGPARERNDVDARGPARERNDVDVPTSATGEAHAMDERSGTLPASASAARAGTSERTESAPSEGAQLAGSDSSQGGPASSSRPARISTAGAVTRRDETPARSAGASTPARAGWRVRLLGLYSGGHESAALGWQHGLRAETALRLWRGTYAGAGYAYLAPRELAGTLATVRVQGHGFGAFVGFAHSFGAFGLAADLGFGSLRSRRETLRTASGFRETSDAVRWEPRLGLRVHALWRVPGVARLRLDLAPALELALAPRDLVVSGDLDNPLSSPRWLRARLDVGACFDVL